MKKNNGFAIVYTFMIVILVVGLVACGYLLVKTQKELKGLKNEEPKITSVEGNTATERNIVSSDERYQVFSEGIQQSNAKLENSDETPNGEKCTPLYTGIIDSAFTYNESITSIYIDTNRDVYLTFSADSTLAKEHGEKYKIASNAINCGINQVGQDAFGMIWVIDINGNVWLSGNISAFKEDSVNLTLKQEESLKNIVNVSKLSTASGELLLFIDMDGNMH